VLTHDEEEEEVLTWVDVTCTKVRFGIVATPLLIKPILSSALDPSRMTDVLIQIDYFRSS
jgi:hypothetical protein